MEVTYVHAATWSWPGVLGACSWEVTAGMDFVGELHGLFHAATPTPSLSVLFFAFLDLRLGLEPLCALHSAACGVLYYAPSGASHSLQCAFSSAVQWPP